MLISHVVLVLLFSHVVVNFLLSSHVVLCYSPIWQYMKAKPCWYGMKIWCLANAKSKFFQKMEVYCDVGHEDVEHAIGYKIVYGLMDVNKNKNHIVTCDKLKKNLTPFWDLLKVGVHAT